MDFGPDKTKMAKKELETMFAGETGQGNYLVQNR